ncbi:MAG TPA: SLC13 family permease [Xanthomonadaceae bacterium]|nr:SLC13 family permease [Xanthomonadaceae bacterium]
MEKFYLLGLILVALVLFASEKVRADMVAIGVTLALMIGGVLTVEEGFLGFASPAVITVIAMFVLSAALVRTGVADSLANAILATGTRSLPLLTLMIMLLVGTMSAFMNNIAAVAILMPMVFALAGRTGQPVSKLLIPLSFGSLMGGLTTLVGTPPNLLAANALEQAGYPGFAMFDFLPTGLAVMAVGVVYMLLMGSRTIPEREPAGRAAGEQPLRRYVTEVEVPESSSLIGKTVSEAKLRDRLGLVVGRLHRRYRKDADEGPLDRPWLAHGRYGREEDADTYSFVPWPETVIVAGDHLQLEGNPALLLQKQGPKFLELVGSQMSESQPDEGMGQLGEVAIAPTSGAVGHSLEEATFNARYGISVIAVRRSGREVTERLNTLRLEPGDVLLIRGSSEALAELAHNPDFLVVNRLEHAERDRRRAKYAVAIMALTVLAAATGTLHISVAAMTGMLLMVAAGCMPLRELYGHIDWRVIFMIACMIPLGIAMDDNHTGAAMWLAQSTLMLTGQGNPTLVLAVLMLLTIGLTQVMSNAACVVLVAPIAIAIAQGMGIDPHAFIMGVAIAASTAFLTPIGHQANLLVYGVGNYRFADFTRVGGPLTLLIMAVSLFVVPLVWGF